MRPSSSSSSSSIVEASRPPLELGHPSLITYLCEAMRDMYYSLLDTRMAAVYRGEQALLRTLTSPFPERQFMSQDEFAAYVAWSADPVQEGDRAQAAEASAMDEDAEDEDSDEE
ncbi:hypothetical protein LR48_Vigan11g056300 [Vigna angularis]|uniref:Uncharacterized protein n=1 Tax=Phaseolus angularis TaxID=3914 RepID=A0A0L9VR45_PHAAN|nr:hypothetical protein LR48_Vigan11g056300 [Vigna angularis]